MSVFEVSSSSLQLHSVRLHGAADGLRARQRFEAAVAAIDSAALGLPPRTLLIIRRIAPTARLSLDPSGRRGDGAFAQSVQAELTHNAQQARRTWLHGDAARAEAVLFADERELMACLVRDWLRGTLAGRWWAPTLLGSLPAPEWWRRNLLPRGDLLPAVLSLLSEQAEAVAWVARLSEAEVTQAVTAITAAHAMNILSEWLKPVPLLRSDERSLAKEASVLRQDQQTKTHIPAPPSGSRQGSIAALGHLVALIPELQANTLTISQRRLLALALGLQRASGWTRSPAFVVALQAMEMESSGVKDSVPDNISKANDANSTAPVAKESNTHGSNLTDKPKPVAHSVEQRFDKALPSAAEGLRRDDVLSIPLDDLRVKKPSPAGEGGVRGNLNKEKSLFISPNPNPFDTAHGRLIPEGKGVSIIESSALPPVVNLSNHEEGLVGTLHNDTQAEVLPSLPALSPEFTPHPNTELATLFQQSIETQFGGLFYLLNVALALGLYGDFTQPCAQSISLSPWDWLALTGRAWFGRDFEQDPVWPLLAELAGRSSEEEPGCDFVPPNVWIVPDEWLKPWGESKRVTVYITQKRLQIRHKAGFVLIDVARIVGMAPLVQARQLCAQSEVLDAAQLVRIHRQPQQLVQPITGSPALKRWLRWVLLYLHARLQRALGSSQKLTSHRIVPTLQRGNAASDAPASRNAGALPDEFPRRSVGTIKSPHPNPFDTAQDRLLPEGEGARILKSTALWSLAHMVCCHTAKINCTATTLDVHLALAALPIELRIAGLDRDPGWIPAAGRSLAFHFE